MSTQFDPELKIHNSELKEPENNSLVDNPKNGASTHTNEQHLKPASPKSSFNINDFQQLDKLTTQNSQKTGILGWKKLGLTQKVTALAIALGTVPVLLTGITAYNAANQKFSEQITQTQVDRASSLEDKVKRFMRERYGDIQVLSSQPAFTNSKASEALPLTEKQAILNRYIDSYLVYDSIAILDLKGDVIAQSVGNPLPNLSDRDYFQAVLKTDQPVVSSPQISKETGKYSINFAAPIKDSVTGKTTTIVVSRLPINLLEDLIKDFGINGEQYFLIDASTGKIFLSKEKNTEGKDVTAIFSNLPELRSIVKPGSTIVTDKTDNEEELVAYAPFVKLEGLQDLKWTAAMVTPTSVAFAPQRQLLLILTIGTGLTTLLVSVIAAYLARQATRPIVEASEAVEKLGQGELYTRVTVEGEDEFATLGSNINLMASRIESLLWTQAAETEQVGLFGDIAISRARTSEDLNEIFEKAVQGALRILEADRVVIYRFHPDWRGYIATEAVMPVWQRSLGGTVEDACIAQHLIEDYRQGRVVATDNVFEAGFHPEHLELMERLQIKANLVTPIISDGQLYGLLIAHHCAAPHDWQQSEINFLKELAIRVGLSLERVSFLEQKDAETERAQQLNETSTAIRESFSIEDIYQAAVSGTRNSLKTDRTVVYLFDENWQGSVVAESVGQGFTKALGANIADPCFADRYVEKYLKGRVKAVDNIYEAGLTDCYLGQLEPFEVKANLVAPILAYNKLHGLLVTHQCSSTRYWQDPEIIFFKEVATQVGLALDRVDFLAQLQQARQKAEGLAFEQRNQKETLQQQLLSLLSDVEGAARGDLTVRADVTVGEIGTVADFFNAVIESLRDIVTQVKKAATQVNNSLGNNKDAMSLLSSEALQQAEETTRTLDSVEQMTRSIQQVAESARQAAVVARTASSTAEAGGLAM
ncbi:MAG: GAF domain-containing protein, partial [Coleofasciculaceae cyanobacterium]